METLSKDASIIGVKKKIFLSTDDVVKKEIEDFIKLPFIFNGFKKVDELSDGEISLKIKEYIKGNHERNRVPNYRYNIVLHKHIIGVIDLRIGYTEGLYYGGNIGYTILEKYRGNGYAGRACELVKQVAKLHNMKILCITNEENNNASIRVCEKLNLKYIRTVELPEDNEMRVKKEALNNNIFYWEI